jgi:hypothetical protein
MEESAYGRLDAPIGSHVVTPRRGYLHHGIYVGDGKVVHYAGLCYGLHSGPVEEVALTRFADGRPVWIRSDVAPIFDPQETVRRARSRVGEDRYRLLTNNCEHFCEWCLRGRPRSHQVEALLTQPGRAVQAMLGFIAWVAELAYGFFAYEEHQPFADTAFPAKRGQGPEAAPAAPWYRAQLEHEDPATY